MRFIERILERLLAWMRQRRTGITAATVLPASLVSELVMERMARQMAAEMLRSPETREMAKILPTLGFDQWRTDVFERYAKERPEVRAAMDEVQRYGVSPEAVLRCLYRELCRGVAN